MKIGLSEPVLRWVKTADYPELVNLYHLARTALVGPKVPTHVERAAWAAREWAKIHTYASPVAAYKDLTANIFAS